MCGSRRHGSLREDLPQITTFLNRLLALTIELQNVIFDVFEGLLTARIEGAIAAGTYDRGLETVVAESLAVTARQTIYVHPQTGAETQAFTIRRRDRNHPMLLEAALKCAAAEPRAQLLVNGQSGRAAVQVPAPSLTLDDGEVERRVRLLRPMESFSLALSKFEQTQWQAADRNAFEAAWLAELADVPTFTDSAMHIVTGLLLPIWKQLPSDSTRVYRLQTDDGERIVGRLVHAEWLQGMLGQDTPALNSGEAWAGLIGGTKTIHLKDSLDLRRVKVMGDHRVELNGFTGGMVDRLKALGLFSELIAWKLRLFVPTGNVATAVMGQLLERYPIVRVTDRKPA